MQRKIKRRKRNVFYFPFLVVRGTALGELKDNRPAGQSAVNLAVGIESVVDTTTLLLIQDNLDGLAAVLLGADALSDNLDGVDEVGEDGVVDGRQSTRTGTLLGLVAAGVGGALGAGEDTALSDEEDVTVRELLLELAGQAVLQVSFSVLFCFLHFLVNAFCVSGIVPLLNLVEALEERDGDEDEDSLLAVTDLDL